MAIGETVITIVGNLTADPELRHHRPGRAGRQLHDRQHATPVQPADRTVRGRRRALPPLFGMERPRPAHRPVMVKGMRVIAQGRLSQHSYQAQDGTNRTVVEMTGGRDRPSLRYATAQVSRISRQPQGPVYGNPAAQTPTVNTGAGGWNQQPAQSTQPAAPADDPWGAPSDDQSSFGGFGKPDPEPDF